MFRSIEKNARNISPILVIILVLSLLLGQMFLLTALIITSIVLSYFLGVSGLRALGVELVLFSSVLTGMAYGSLAGASLALILILIHMIATQHVNVYLIWVVPVYVLVGYLSGSTELSIAYFGLISALGVNAFNLLITAIVFRSNVANFAPFAITNVLFNAFLFVFVAPLIVLQINF